MALSFDKNRSKINWLPMTTSQVFQNFSQRTSCLLVRRFYAHKVKWNTEISEHLLFTNKASWVLKINFSPSTIWINCSTYLKKFANSRPSASNFKRFFLTVDQNNFGNSILLPTRTTFIRKWMLFPQKILLCKLPIKKTEGRKNCLTLKSHLWPGNL